jgi:hypothetical protein
VAGDKAFDIDNPEKSCAPQRRYKRDFNTSDTIVLITSPLGLAFLPFPPDANCKPPQVVQSSLAI